jgi:hypothetical protein
MGDRRQRSQEYPRFQQFQGQRSPTRLPQRRSARAQPTLTAALSEPHLGRDGAHYRFSAIIASPGGMARFADNLGNFGRTGCEDSIKHAGSSGTSQVAQMSQPLRDVTFRIIASITHDDPRRPPSIPVDPTTIPAWYHSLMVLNRGALSTKKLIRGRQFETDR